MSTRSTSRTSSTRFALRPAARRGGKLVEWTPVPVLTRASLPAVCSARDDCPRLPHGHVPLLGPMDCAPAQRAARCVQRQQVRPFVSRSTARARFHPDPVRHVLTLANDSLPRRIVNKQQSFDATEIFRTVRPILPPRTHGARDSLAVSAESCTDCDPSRVRRCSCRATRRSASSSSASTCSLCMSDLMHLCGAPSDVTARSYLSPPSQLLLPLPHDPRAHLGYVLLCPLAAVARMPLTSSSLGSQ